MSETKNIRGYVFSQPFFGERVPQAVQNLVIRDFCSRNKFNYLLSATEYAMPDCSAILTGVCKELDQIDGIAAYSLFMLPSSRTKRYSIYETFFEHGALLCGAVENIIISSSEGAEKFEETMSVRRLVDQHPIDSILTSLADHVENEAS